MEETQSNVWDGGWIGSSDMKEVYTLQVLLGFKTRNYFVFRFVMDAFEAIIQKIATDFDAKLNQKRQDCSKTRSALTELGLFGVGSEWEALLKRVWKFHKIQHDFWHGHYWAHHYFSS